MTDKTILFDTNGTKVFGTFAVPIELENEYGITEYTLEVLIERDISSNVPPYFDTGIWDSINYQERYENFGLTIIDLP